MAASIGGARRWSTSWSCQCFRARRRDQTWRRFAWPRTCALVGQPIESVVEQSSDSRRRIVALARSSAPSDVDSLILQPKRGGGFPDGDRPSRYLAPPPGLSEMAQSAPAPRADAPGECTEHWRRGAGGCTILRSCEVNRVVTFLKSTDGSAQRLLAGRINPRGWLVEQAKARKPLSGSMRNR